MTKNEKIFRRVLEKKIESGLTWDQVHTKTGIPLASWMTGTPGTKISDGDLKRLAPVFNTTYEYLKYGRK